jgi:hypothetical protein
MIDVETEKLISLARAASLVPPARRGKKTHISTLVRWITQGVKGVKLEALRLGGRWFTSAAAMQRFAERLTPKSDEPVMVPRSPVTRECASKRAERELRKLGI